MSLDSKDVAKIARLARIQVTDEDKSFYAAELSKILSWVEQLGEVDTDGVPQMTSVAAMKLPWREDKVTEGNQAEAVVKNAPESDHGCFVVPKVLE